MPTPLGWSQNTAVPLSGDDFSDSLIGGRKWGGSVGSGVTVKYSFPGSDSLWSTNATTGYGPTDSDNEPWSDWSAPLTSVQMSAARTTLHSWSNVANIKFLEVADTASAVGDIRFTWSYTSFMDGESAHAYFPGNAPKAGDIWLNYFSDLPSFSTGTWGFFTLLHEIGHAIGLKHSFETEPGNGNTLPASYDAWHFTVMSYEAVPGVEGVGWSYMPTTPMVFDIAALQYLYGTNTTYHSGNDVYTYQQGENYFETIWDAGGIDTIQYQGNDHCEIDLRGGALSNLGNQLYTLDFSYSSDYTVVIYDSVVIENAIGGGGNDLLIGNNVVNRLTGNAGNDSLNGNAGNDILNGGSGSDNLNGGAGADRLLGGTGNDTLIWGTGDAKLDGGGGTDSLKLSVDLNVTDLTALNNLRFVNLEQINMTGGGIDVLTLNKFDVLDMSPTDTLKVLGDAGDVVHRGSGWTTLTDVSIGGIMYDRYTKSGATLLVDTDINSVV